MSDTPPSNIDLIFDSGTAYEFFTSLHVLMEPDYYGIRASWAAGIRSRIPAAERRLLEEVFPFLGVPLHWINSLPTPKDGISVLWAMRHIPPAERIIKVFDLENCSEEHCQSLLRIASEGKWDSRDLDGFLEHYQGKGKTPFTREGIATYLDWWKQPARFGEGFLEALQAYHQAFFEQEEKRVGPVLQDGLARAKDLAGRLSLDELLSELSQGVRFDEPVKVKEVVIVPAFWTTPLVLFEQIKDERLYFMFGARPATMSAIPGELIPDGLLRTLKALADPTRLKILYYLAQEQMTPSELARRLHLRAPTVTHHLSELRLAGLVNLTVKGQEKKYTTRRESLQGAFTNLEAFLDNE